ncbi:uncharacterized protein LOC129220736 [Uloborus diversus]|uniref:uncharacterized protein LOC129220736 n=1 Tax=Uloborus diversus TaxID=327109 RepID=UPI00240979BC|nr:uncharacterized protein LOC129220736 [Uloborus diversus]
MSHRRGDYSNLEKPGFLWVHFGSGSSPVSSLKKRPNLTSQRTRKESALASKEQNTPRGKFSKTEKNIVLKHDATHSTRQRLSLIEKDKRKVNAQIDKDHAKTDDSLSQNTPQTNPALQVSSKILTNKHLGKKTTVDKDFQKKLVGKNDKKEVIQKPKASTQKQIKELPESETIKKLPKFCPEKHLKKTSNAQEKKLEGKKLDSKIPCSNTSKKNIVDLKKTETKTDSTTIAVEPQSLAPASKINGAGSENFSSRNNNPERKESKSQKQNEHQEIDDLKKELNDLGDDQSKRPSHRLCETAKSSSLDEGDVRLVIERKRDPEISIKISVKDRNKKKAQKKESFTTDISSTQGESDYSLMKDSGYISTSESVHNHRRSIMIDLGHTTAKINAGMRNMTETSLESLNFTEEDNAKDALTNSNVVLPLVSTDSNQQKEEKKNENSPRVNAPSKLPILNSQRQRSNSMILMEYHRSPRRNSLNTYEPMSETELSKSTHSPKSARNAVQISRSMIPRQIGGNVAAKRRKSNIPIYRTHSDSNLHKEKISPRLTGLSSSTPSIHDELERKMIYSERKMDILREQSSSTETRPDIEEQYRNVDTLKLPSICLTKPDEKATKLQVGGSQFPEIAMTSKEASPRKDTVPSRASSILSYESMDLKLPILQQPIRCKCSIEPHKYWDARRSKSAIDCVANLHFLSEEELAQFDTRLLALSGRSSYSGGHRKRLSKKPIGYKALRTQTLKRLSTGKLNRKSQQAVTFHVDHNKERNTFQLPTEKLQQNKKWQVVFTIGKSGKENKKTEVDDNK